MKQPTHQRIVAIATDRAKQLPAARGETRAGCQAMRLFAQDFPRKPLLSDRRENSKLLPNEQYNGLG